MTPNLGYDYDIPTLIMIKIHWKRVVEIPNELRPLFLVDIRPDGLHSHHVNRPKGHKVEI